MSAGECPRRSLTPQDTCIQQSAALCLHGAQTPVFGVRAPGVRGDKPAAPSTLTLPLQRSPCSSMRKGIPLSAWENMGRPPGHGFSPSLGWLFSGLDLATHAHSGSPTTSLPPVTCPTLSCLTICTGSLGTCLGNGSPHRHPEDRAISHGPHFPADLPAPHRQCAQERLGDRGPGSGIFQGAL